MGKGDIKTRRGKRKAGTAGVSRQKKKASIVIPEKPAKAKKAAAKKTTTKKTTTAKKATTKKTTAKKSEKKD